MNCRGHSMRNFMKWMGLISGCLAMTACMTMEPLSIDKEKLKNDLRPGDKVEISRRNGQHLEFNVSSIDEQGVHGSGIHIPYRDIKAISRETTSWWRTALV